MPKVLNRRTDQIPPDAVYVGRPSKWGNPYQLDSHRTRKEAIRLYRILLLSRLAVDPDWLEPLSGKDLVCWCAPRPCHAYVLLELANA